MSRRTIVAGAAWAVPAVVAVNTLPAWAASPTDFVPCPNGSFATVGRGRLLSGSLLGIDLDTLAAVNGIIVGNDGHGAVTPTTWGAGTISDSPVANDAYAFVNAVDLGVLYGALDVSAGITLPVNTDLGVVNQYGRAVQNGISAGASGAVTDHGAIATTPTKGWPTYAVVNLKTLLASVNTTLAAAVASIADVSLLVGAVAGRATRDACPTTPNPFSRTYILAYLKTVVTTTKVGQLVSAVDTSIGGLGTSLNTLADSTIGGLLTTVKGLVNPSLQTLGFRLGTASVSVTVGTSSTLDALLAGPLTDSTGVLSIDLSGTDAISIDLGALLGYPYDATQGSRLNDLPANTELAINSTVINTLTQTTLKNVLQSWVNNVIDALRDVIQVRVEITVDQGTPVFGGNWQQVGKIVIDASLQKFLNGNADVTVDLPGVLGGILSTVTTPLIDSLVKPLGTVLDEALQSALTTATSTLASDIVTAVDDVFTAIYGNNLVSLLVNAQNLATGTPDDWASLGLDRYDVAALRLGVLDALHLHDVRLYLGRGSVGANTAV